MKLGKLLYGAQEDSSSTGQSVKVGNGTLVGSFQRKYPFIEEYVYRTASK